MSSTRSKTKAARLAAWRKDNPRIDYYPEPEVAELIERARAQNPRHSMRAILDALIVAGYKALSGSAGR